MLLSLTIVDARTVASPLVICLLQFKFANARVLPGFIFSGRCLLLGTPLFSNTFCCPNASAPGSSLAGVSVAQFTDRGSSESATCRAANNLPLSVYHLNACELSRNDKGNKSATDFTAIPCDRIHSDPFPL
jgi:hypothetical protein